MKIKVKFRGDTGEEVLVTFDRDAGTFAADDGRKGTYSRPEGSKTMDIKGDAPMSVTFADEVRFEAGYSTRYTTTAGHAGTATIMSVG